MRGTRRYLGLRGTSLNIAIGCIAGLDFLLFGYDEGVMARSLLTLPSFIAVFPEIDTTPAGEAAAGLTTEAEQTHRSTIQGIAVSAYNLGCFCGALATNFIGDRLGRRKTIFLESSIMIIGAVLQSS